MADLLTHVLVVLVVLTAASWRIERLERRWIVVAMGGAVIPDLEKLRLLVDGETVEAVLGLPFGWGTLSTLGGVLLVAGAITVAFQRQYWRRVYGLLVFGGFSALVVDGLRIFADGRSSTWLFPVLPSYRPPTPNLYVSSDPVVPVLMVAVAIVVVGVDRWAVTDSTWW